MQKIELNRNALILLSFFVCVYTGILAPTARSSENNFDLTRGILPISPLVTKDDEKRAVRYLDKSWRQILTELDPNIHIAPAPTMRKWDDSWPYGIDVKSHDLGWEIVKIIPGSSAAIDGALQVGDVLFTGTKNIFKGKVLDPEEFDNTPFIEGEPELIYDLLYGKTGDELTFEVIPKGKPLGYLELKLGRFHHTARMMLSFAQHPKHNLKALLAIGEKYSAVVYEGVLPGTTLPTVSMTVYQATTFDDMVPKRQVLRYATNRNGIVGVAVNSTEHPGFEEYFAAKWRYQAKKVPTSGVSEAVWKLTKERGIAASKTSPYQTSLPYLYQGLPYSEKTAPLLAYGSKTMPGGNAAALRFVDHTGDGISVASGRRPFGYRDGLAMLRVNWTLYDKREGLRTSHNGFDRSYLPLGPLLQIQGHKKKGFPEAGSKMKLGKSAWYVGPVKTDDYKWPYSFYSRLKAFQMASCEVSSKLLSYELSTSGMHTVSFNKGIEKKCDTVWEPGFASAPITGEEFFLSEADQQRERRPWAYATKLHLEKIGTRHSVLGTILNPSPDNRWVMLHGEGKISRWVGEENQKDIMGTWRQGLLDEGTIGYPNTVKGAFRQYYGRTLDVSIIQDTPQIFYNRRTTTDWNSYTPEPIGYLQSDYTTETGTDQKVRRIGLKWRANAYNGSKQYVFRFDKYARQFSNLGDSYLENLAYKAASNGRVIQDGLTRITNYSTYDWRKLYMAGKPVGYFTSQDDRGNYRTEITGFYTPQYWDPRYADHLSPKEKQTAVNKFWQKEANNSGPTPTMPSYANKEAQDHFAQCHYFEISRKFSKRQKMTPYSTKFRCGESKLGQKANFKSYNMPKFWGDKVIFLDYQGGKDAQGFAHGYAYGWRQLDNRILKYRWEHGWPVAIEAGLAKSLIRTGFYTSIKYSGPVNEMGIPHGRGQTPLIETTRFDSYYTGKRTVQFEEPVYSKTKTVAVTVDNGILLEMPQAVLRDRLRSKNAALSDIASSDRDRVYAEKEAAREAEERREREAELAEERRERAEREAARERRRAKAQARADANARSWNQFVENNRHNAEQFNRQVDHNNRKVAEAFEDMNRQKRERQAAADRQTAENYRQHQSRQTQQASARTTSQQKQVAPMTTSERAKKIEAEQKALADQRRRVAQGLDMRERSTDTNKDTMDSAPHYITSDLASDIPPTNKYKKLEEEFQQNKMIKEQLEQQQDEEHRQAADKEKDKRKEGYFLYTTFLTSVHNNEKCFQDFKIYAFSGLKGIFCRDQPKGNLFDDMYMAITNNTNYVITFDAQITFGNGREETYRGEKVQAGATRKFKSFDMDSAAPEEGGVNSIVFTRIYQKGASPQDAELEP